MPGAVFLGKELPHRTDTEEDRPWAS
jgi:hypothetical protein